MILLLKKGQHLQIHPLSFFNFPQEKQRYLFSFSFIIFPDFKSMKFDFICTIPGLTALDDTVFKKTLNLSSVVSVTRLLNH